MCAWRISTRNHYRVRIKFSVFEIERTLNCEFDSIEIYDGKHKLESRLIGRYCGKQAPTGIISSGMFDDAFQGFILAIINNNKPCSHFL